ncbi:MAG: tRNA lysidine(34) synthetase TilS [Tahibacter sp.]
MSNSSLPEFLRASLAELPGGPLLVGLSGGLDSSVLLHALASLPEARQRGLIAVHIDHGLRAESAAWTAHCADFARQLAIPFRSAVARVERDSGAGLEASARAARYAAFSTLMQRGEILTTAHHRDDQTETVLLKLLRGAGARGLAGMRRLRPFAAGLLWRPLLPLPRHILAEWAARHALNFIDDPSNAETRHARNFLRHEVLPLLRTRWPQLDVAIGHSARWLDANADFIDTETHKALARVQGLDPATLRWAEWMELHDALRASGLRLWLRELRLPEPEQVHIAELERQLSNSDPQRLPCVSWAGCELRRHRDMLYAMAPLRTPPADWTSSWAGEALTLPADCGSLHLKIVTHCNNLDTLTVRFRRGGEIFRPAGDIHRRELRDLLQSAGIPPWQRRRIPLIFRESTLLAVADLWCSEEGAAYFKDRGVRLVWRESSVSHETTVTNPIDPAAALR